MNFKAVHSAGPDPAPGYSPRGMTACHTRWQDSRVVLDLAARSSGENGPCAGRGHARRACGAVIVHVMVQWHTHRWQGATGKHQWDPDVALGKEEGQEHTRKVGRR
jgi:hypothetical protein